MKLSDFLTVTQVADRIDRSRQRVHQLIDEGVVRSHELGGRKFISKPDFKEFRKKFRKKRK